MTQLVKSQVPRITDSDSDDDEPLMKRIPSPVKPQLAVDVPVQNSDSDSEPLMTRVKAPPLDSTVKKTASMDSDLDMNGEEEDSEEDRPLVARVAAPPVAAPQPDSDSDDDDEPLMKRVQAPGVDSDDEEESDFQPASSKPPASKQAAAMRKKIADSEDEDDEEDDFQPAVKKKKGKPAAARKKVKADSEEEDSEDEEDFKPAARAPKKAKTSATSAKSVGKKKVAKSSSPAKKQASQNGRKRKAAADEEDDVDVKPQKKKEEDNEENEEEEGEEEYKWWEDANQLDHSIKWQTLEHNGVFFPPEYKPHGVQMKYDGKPLKLSPESEEVAGFFAALLGTPYVENPTFCKNFFNDFQEMLDAHDPGHPVREFEKCDFTPMFEHFERMKEQKKLMTKEEKDALKAEKQQLEERFGWALINGRREKVGNFRIEPPGLFRGRGDHPKTGTLKRRVTPEQVTINIGEGAKVPEPPEGHEWAGVVHDNTVGWLATWTENVNNNIKYVLFGAGSSLKGMSDFKKFEKARELKKHIDVIRQNYMEQLKDKMMAVRQMATALWLIDKLALRAGNEKGDDEADTVGCCSLRYEHVELDEDVEQMPDPDNPGQTKEIRKKMVTFDFLGKDSIRYYNRVEVHPRVWKNLQLFKSPPKKEGDPLFDRLTTQMLNKHLNSLMPGLTAKVFRTYNASITFQIELKKTPEDANVAEKVLAYNRANRQVAVLCNHQRTVSKAHGAQMEKISEKILSLKYELELVKQDMLKLEPKLKKKRPELAEMESDMDEDIMERKEKEHEQLEQERLEKRYQKMCEKAAAEGLDKPDKPKPTKKEASSIEKLEKKYESLCQRIIQAKTMKVDKDENKTTALGTSKINYIDPRITSSWCNKYSVPIEKMFTKTLRDKFKWAMESEADWEF